MHKLNEGTSLPVQDPIPFISTMLTPSERVLSTNHKNYSLCIYFRKCKVKNSHYLVFLFLISYTRSFLIRITHSLDWGSDQKKTNYPLVSLLSVIYKLLKNSFVLFQI